MIKGIIIGVFGVFIIGLIGAFCVVVFGLVPANADARPSYLEAWMAHHALHAVLVREAPKTPNPLPLTNNNLIRGIQLYAMNCAICHGVADGQASNIAQGLYQTPPQLSFNGVENDPPGFTYWKIYHGIRFTGMPCFRRTLTTQEIWKLCLFLKNMDRLPPKAKSFWHSLPSASH
jgi:mono/diheme cytochrome c family protein